MTSDIPIAPVESLGATGSGWSVLRTWRWHIAIALAAMCVWALASWLIAGAVARDRAARLIDDQRRTALRDVEMVDDDLVRTLAHVRVIPTLVATNPAVVAALSRFGSEVKASPLPFDERQRAWLAQPELVGIGRQLRYIVEIANTNIDSVCVMNAAGDGFAAGALPSDPSCVGGNYADREYFRATRFGENGYQFTLGRTTGVLGLVLSTPVLVDRSFIGSVAVRVRHADLQRLIDSDPGFFATDDNGVVILANDPKLVMRAIPGNRIDLMAPQERLAVYKRETFEPLVLPVANSSAPALDFWSGEFKAEAIAVRAKSRALMSVYLVREVEGLKAIGRDRVALAYLLDAIGALVVVAVLGSGTYWSTRNRHRRELQALNVALTRQAQTDSLTGCVNRWHFLQMLETERQRALRHSRNVSLLWLDLDHFKAINDRHGHSSGDEVLRQFAAVVRASLRPSDTLARMGGEEFVVLLPETSIEQAAIMAERIRAAVEALRVVIASGSIALTVSIGVAQMRLDESIETLLLRVDAAMYAAKNAGRNQIGVETGSGVVRTLHGEPAQVAEARA